MKKKLRPPAAAAAPPAAIQNFDAMPDCAFVRLPTVCTLFGISKPTVWRWVANGQLPAPRKLSRAVTAWRVGELRRALAGPMTEKASGVREAAKAAAAAARTTGGERGE